MLFGATGEAPSLSGWGQGCAGVLAGGIGFVVLACDDASEMDVVVGIGGATVASSLGGATEDTSPTVCCGVGWAAVFGCSGVPQAATISSAISARHIWKQYFIKTSKETARFRAATELERDARM